MTPLSPFKRGSSPPHKRPPAAAGGFYPSTRSSVRALIKDCFQHEFGPGSVPDVGHRRGDLLGLVVPHAGWVYSGPIAARSYAALYRDGFPETFIILGPNHTGLGSLVATTDVTFETPLGEIEIDKEIVEAFRGTIIDNDYEAHMEEHSIEVQLPFLQYSGKAFKLVPIVLAFQDWATVKDVAGAIVSAVKKTKRDVVIIASSDFTHAGFMYRDSPPEGYTPGEYAKKKDSAALDMIKAFDPGGLIRTVDENRITMCGPGCVAAMLLATKHLGAKKVDFLGYATSQDVKKERHADLAVGYGAFAVYRA